MTFRPIGKKRFSVPKHLLMAGGIFGLASCIIRESTAVKPSSDSPVAAAPNASAPSATSQAPEQSSGFHWGFLSSPNFIEILEPTGGKPMARLQFDSACADEDKSLAQVWVVPFETPFGEHLAQFTGKVTGGEGAKIKVDNFEVGLAVANQTLDGAEIRRICDEGRRGPATGTPILRDQIKGWLQQLSRDCQFAFQDRWQCEMKEANPANVLAANNSREKKLIRQGARQPYTLMRKLSATSQLATFLSERNDERAKTAMCAIWQRSTPDELPMVFSGGVWLNKFCGTSEGSQRLGRIGLELADRELDAEVTRLETLSKTGNIRVQLPQEGLAGKFLRITLVPKEVAIAKGGASKPLPACWHPLFADDNTQRNVLATNLEIIAPQKGVECLTPVSDQDRQEVQKILANNLISEREFFVPNGSVKTLQLPLGSYSYTLEALPANPLNWSGEKPLRLARGELSWSKARETEQIQSW